MSSDARAWRDASGGWLGSHDGPCQLEPDDRHKRNSHELTTLLTELEACIGQDLRWEIENGGPMRGDMLFGWLA